MDEILEGFAEWSDEIDAQITDEMADYHSRLEYEERIAMSAPRDSRWVKAINWLRGEGVRI